MAKAEGFTSVLIFPSMWRSCVRWVSAHRMPPLLRRRAIDALLQVVLPL
jgi:hypothetical protein